MHYIKDHERYSYVKPLFSWHKLFYVLSIISLIILTVGFYVTYNHNVWYFPFFFTGVLFIVTYLIISTAINLFYQPFDVELHDKHVDGFWGGPVPSIDVYLPICGEDIRVVQNTWDGVREMRSTYEGQMNVYVLDDKGSSEYESMAQVFGFTYLSRPNKGEMKKAGNLLYAFNRTQGEYIVIFDADFRPHPDFAYELLPYMADDSVGIVQSPQFFDYNDEVHQHSPLEYGAGNVQEYFYRIIQPSRGNFAGGSICVGSCAIYRRKALDSIGGMVQIEHSEDVWTGYKLINAGWKIRYVPLALSKGVCPSDMNSFFKQQTRWCSGSMSLMVSSAFWKAPIGWKTKLCYIAILNHL